MFQINRLKSHMYFVLDALCIDHLMLIFFSLRFWNWWLIIRDFWLMEYFLHVMHVSCWLFCFRQIRFSCHWIWSNLWRWNIFVIESWCWSFWWFCFFWSRNHHWQKSKCHRFEIQLQQMIRCNKINTNRTLIR